MPWLQTRNDIIKRALRIIGAIDQGDTPSAEQFSEGSVALNALILSLSVESVKLWTREWITKSLTASSVVTNGGNTYTCIRSHTASAAGAAGSEPGVGSQWKMYWALTGTGGSAWAALTAYTAIGDFLLDQDVLKVSKFFGRVDGIDHDIEMVDYEKYLTEFNKSETSSYPSYVWLDRGIQQRAYLWPQPQDTTTIIHYYADKVIPELDDASDNPNLHGKLYDLLSYNLAANLADEYGIGIAERNWVKGRADEFKRLSRMNDVEDVSGSFIEGAY